MKIYWTMSSVPELEGLEPREKRKRFAALQKEGRKDMGVMPYVYLFLIGFAVGLGAVFLGLGGALMGAAIGASVGIAYAVIIQTPAIERGRIWYREQTWQD